MNDKTSSQSNLNNFADKGSERKPILLQKQEREAINSARISMQQPNGEMWRCSVDVLAAMSTEKPNALVCCDK